MRLRDRQRGFATFFVILTIVPILAMVGFVTDIGWYYFTTEEARAAAESAALAAVQSAMDSVKTNAGSYNCGSGTVTCQAATGCVVPAPSPVTSNLQHGCVYAAANGFTNSGSQTVTIQGGDTSPAPTVPGVFVLYWATVRITQSNPLTFLAVLGGSTLSVGVRSTAAVVQTPVSWCIIALDPTASKSLTASGIASVSAANCGVADASDNSKAIVTNGGGSISGSSISVVGGANCGGCSPSPTTVSAVRNPFSGLPVPTFSPSPCAPAYSPTGTATISQGTYCGDIATSGTLTLNPGTYILLGGNLATTGTGTISGTGVFIYSTCNPSPCNGNASGNINLVGTGSVNLSSATTANSVYANILYYQDPTASNTGTSKFTGNSSSCLSGVVYLPESAVSYSGGSSSGSCNTYLASDTISFVGNSNLGSTSLPNSGVAAPTALLIE